MHGVEWTRSDAAEAGAAQEWFGGAQVEDLRKQLTDERRSRLVQEAWRLSKRRTFLAGCGDGSNPKCARTSCGAPAGPAVAKDGTDPITKRGRGEAG